MKKILWFTVVALALLTGCTDSDGARRVLSDQGYTDIQITGYRPLSCGDDYTFETGFAAKSPAGKPVTGVVCNGFIKGYSIKFD